MKILNVNADINTHTGGGTAERTIQMSCALTKLGLICSILTLNFDTNQPRVSRLEKTKVTAIPCLFKRFYIPQFSFNLIGSIVKDTDIIHLMNHWTLLNAVVYVFARRLNKQYVVCPAGALPIYGRSKLIKKIYNRIVGNKIIRNGSAHVAISANEFDHFRAYGVNPENVTLIPNGVNQDEFQLSNDNGFRLKHDLPNNPFVMFLGRLNSIKGPDLLLKAFLHIKDRFKDLHLVYAGPDGGLLRDLEAVVGQEKLQDRVHFIGYISGTEKSQAYHASQVVVIPSRQEAMSIVVLEAGITGTPVLITDQCGFDDVERVGGGKVVPATAEGIQNGLAELLGDQEKLKTMGQKLKNQISEYYTWDKTAKRYYELYQVILGVNN